MELAGLSWDIHAISRQLHPSILDDLGFVEAMKAECASFSRREGIGVSYEHANIPPDLPNGIALCLYRVLQAGLRNVAKHARATAVRVVLRSDEGAIHMVLEDNGIGFHLEEANKNPGLGLVSMKERIHLVQGDLSIESTPRKGTVIKAKIPLKSAEIA